MKSVLGDGDFWFSAFLLGVYALSAVLLIEVMVRVW